jgi:hypothetical protein
MISFIIKHWRLIADMAIVVALVLVFTFWDPFKMFNNRQIVQTANLVSQVRDIGQLVTAEYYGEVISSLNGLKLKKYPLDSVTLFARDLYHEIRQDLTDDQTSVKNYKPEIDDQPYAFLYPQFIAFLAKRYTDKPVSKMFDDSEQKKIKSNIEQKVYNRMNREFDRAIKKIRKNYKDDEERASAIDTYSDSIPAFVNEFYGFYSKLLQKKTGDTDANKNIVFIGRGWVKAGFDFGTLNDKNFAYDKVHKIAHFFGFTSKILDDDINPWFIPENKVKGFELIDYHNKLSFEDAKRVKKDCKVQLLLQAQNANILANAQTNGEEALRTFFSLLLDEPTLKVKIHALPYDHILTTIERDSLVFINEAILIDSLYNLELTKINDKKLDAESKLERELNLKQFIGRLKKLHFINEGYPFNYFTMKAAAMLRDSHVDMNDLNNVKALRGTLVFNSKGKSFVNTDISQQNFYWFAEWDFMNDFNAMLKSMNSEADVMVGLQEVALDETAQLRQKHITPLDTIYRNNKWIIQYYDDDTLKVKPYRLADFAYDSRMIEFLAMAELDTMRLDTLKKQTAPRIINTQLDNLRNAELTQLYDSTRKAEINDSRVTPIRRLHKRFIEIVNPE